MAPPSQHSVVNSTVPLPEELTAAHSMLQPIQERMLHIARDLHLLNKANNTARRRRRHQERTKGLAHPRDETCHQQPQHTALSLDDDEVRSSLVEEGYDTLALHRDLLSTVCVGSRSSLPPTSLTIQQAVQQHVFHHVQEQLQRELRIAVGESHMGGTGKDMRTGNSSRSAASVARVRRENKGLQEIQVQSPLGKCATAPQSHSKTSSSVAQRKDSRSSRGDRGKGSRKRVGVGDSDDDAERGAAENAILRATQELRKRTSHFSEQIIVGSTKIDQAQKKTESVTAHLDTTSKTISGDKSSTAQPSAAPTTTRGIITSIVMGGGSITGPLLRQLWELTKFTLGMFLVGALSLSTVMLCVAAPKGGRVWSIAGGMGAAGVTTLDYIGTGVIMAFEAAMGAGQNELFDRNARRFHEQQQQQQNKKTNAQKAYDEWQQQQQHSTHAYKHFPDDEGDMDQLSDAERAEIEEHNRREYYDPQAAGFDYEESDAGADDHDTTSTVGDKWMQSQSGEWQQDQQNSGNGGGSFVAPQNVRVKSREEVLRQQQEQQRSKQQTKQRTSVEILGGSAKVKFADE